jgi:hypothetical protein
MAQTRSQRQKILISLVLFLGLKAVFYSILSLMETSMLGNDLAILLMATIIMEENTRPRVRTVWKHRRQQGFLQNQLLGSYSDKLFRSRLRLNKQTFFFLCQILMPSIGKISTHMNQTVDVETRVAITLTRLATGNTLSTIADLYGVAESTASVIVRECCEAMKIHLKPLVFEQLNKERIEIISQEFEKLHGIPYIMGAIDGSYIPIVAPHQYEAQPYYCRKGFHAVILQEVVDAKCQFWDYDFGWAGSCHDWTVFQRSDLGRHTMRNAFLPYKLIGDAAYPMRPWFYSPFKGTGLSAEKAHWNFIQSSTRMVVERTFGILKGRWRILLKRIDMPLHHVGDIVSACICLHNFCIIHGDKFNKKWAKKAEFELVEASRREFTDPLHKTNTFCIATEAIKQMRIVQLRTGEAIPLAAYDGEDPKNVQLDGLKDELPETKKEREDKDKKLLEDATNQHEMMARTFFAAQLKAKSNLTFQNFVEEESEEESDNE